MVHLVFDAFALCGLGCRIDPVSVGDRGAIRCRIVRGVVLIVHVVGWRRAIAIADLGHSLAVVFDALDVLALLLAQRLLRVAIRGGRCAGLSLMAEVGLLGAVVGLG